MAAGQSAVSFNEIIQAGRQKKKNEELASQILGKNRRASAPGPGAAGKAKNATPGSLASRIGVTKRSASTSSKPKKSKPVVSAAPPPASKASRTKPVNKRRPDEERLITALNPANGQSTVRDNSGGLAIKGASAGPFVIIGSNFAPGTTSADIQSALEPVAGPVLSCWITSQHLSVTAEITFAERWSAEQTIANFHNQKADGRIISMRWKPVGMTANSAVPSAQESFNGRREQADQQRRLNRRADPTVQDGSYGFGAQNNPTHGRDGGRNSRRSRAQGGRDTNQDAQDYGLYSDQMMVDAPSQDSRRHGKWHR